MQAFHSLGQLKQAIHVYVSYFNTKQRLPILNLLDLKQTLSRKKLLKTHYKRNNPYVD